MTPETLSRLQRQAQWAEEQRDIRLTLDYYTARQRYEQRKRRVIIIGLVILALFLLVVLA